MSRMKRGELIRKTTDFMRVKNYSAETIENYTNIISSYLGYILARKDIVALGHKKRIESYLTWLVITKDVSPSTQNVHLSALVLLHNKVLGLDIQGINAVRAKYRHRIPPILSHEQVISLIGALPNEHRTAVKIMYGTGLRIKEALRLRIKDLDFGNQKIIVHEGKGNKDRDVGMPAPLFEELKRQIEIALAQWKIDRSHRIEGVYLPHALAIK